MKSLIVPTGAAIVLSKSTISFAPDVYKRQGVSGILWVLQLRQGQVRGNNQRFPTAVTAVDDVINPVSYTHLDVYKRQLQYHLRFF